jgi:hypothetical protein
MKKSSTLGREKKSASKLIDERISELRDWRGKTLARIRQLIKEADPEIVEEIKWRKPSNPDGVPVWSHDGGICTGETYKDHMKFTFFKGASIEDPFHLFTQPGTMRRAIDLHEGDAIKASAFKNLVREAVALNISSTRRRVQYQT